MDMAFGVPDMTRFHSICTTGLNRILFSPSGPAQLAGAVPVLARASAISAGGGSNVISCGTLAVHVEAKEILALAGAVHDDPSWRTGRADTRQRYCPLHLYLVLIFEISRVRTS